MLEKTFRLGGKYARHVPYLRGFERRRVELCRLRLRRTVGMTMHYVQRANDLLWGAGKKVKITISGVHDPPLFMRMFKPNETI
jgi:hypothetical protein